MIDIHNHVLFGVDDGAKTLADSLNMLKEAKKMGFTELILTPHYFSYKKYLSPVLENQKRFDLLNAAQKKEGINLNLYLGNELLYKYKLENLLNQAIYKPLGKSPWFLVETERRGGTPIGLLNFCDFLLSKGYKMILAHPERYDFVQEEPEWIDTFREHGILIQCNYLSLIDYYRYPAKETLETLLLNDKVDLLASDAHQADGFTLYAEAEKKGIDLIGKEKWQLLMTENAKKLLFNDKKC